MSTIRCIYAKDPGFPASDQHPDAVRYVIGKHIVDAIGGEPTMAEIEAILPSADKQVIASYIATIQQRLDDFARTRGYDGILSAATYATSTVPKFAAEGQYAVQIRDATWAKCYEILATVEAGTRPAPTLDDLLAELPVMIWPS